MQVSNQYTHRRLRWAVVVEAGVFEACRAYAAQRISVVGNAGLRTLPFQAMSLLRGIVSVLVMTFSFVCRLAQDAMEKGWAEKPPGHG